MGRYDGADYGDRPACKPGTHVRMMNGKCSLCGRDVATTYPSANPAHQRDRDEGRIRFKPSTAPALPCPMCADPHSLPQGRCPLCDVEVRGLAFVDTAGFCWHKECYDEEASIGAFNSQEESQ